MECAKGVYEHQSYTAVIYRNYFFIHGNIEAKDLILNNAPTQVYFSPNGGTTSAIVHELGKATTDVFVQAYSFTAKEIAKALLNAHKRGLKVEVILDESNRSKQYSVAASPLMPVSLSTMILYML